MEKQITPQDVTPQEITPSELRHFQESKDSVVLLDVREPWEREIANIAGSQHIPMADISSRLQELNPDQHIVVYCHHGVRSLSVTQWLRRHGYPKVQSVAGGIDQWALEIDPKVPRY